MMILSPIVIVRGWIHDTGGGVEEGLNVRIYGAVVFLSGFFLVVNYVKKYKKYKALKSSETTD